ncbi:TLD-domain-containing protein [Xylona heveae TC161]|uniref:Oxidation resistance protein 1 n=1 Tax=Xylona heveae (strain CBS 132557 / TC161) TaxID=1328760 RepID=A0A165G7I5_XYLHT|nr:TLD-domain-containing protein [Xylona heveae TC161]KZF21829.1 TLD-domain-containing protein [Xylona heveae TC161]
MSSTTDSHDPTSPQQSPSPPSATDPQKPSSPSASSPKHKSKPSIARSPTAPVPAVASTSPSTVSPAPLSPSSHPITSSSASYLTYPVTYAVSGILRRFSADSNGHNLRSTNNSNNHNKTKKMNSNNNGLYTPPNRTASPFTPPPLTPLSLKGYQPSTPTSAAILTRTLAEEIRLLVPPRLQLVEDWNLVYSLEQHGVSLTTLYKRCNEYRGKRCGFVLVVRDSSGGTFGAYLTEPPRPAPHYFGTGECFLWRAHTLSATPELSHLPLPPSADTSNMQRSTTISSGLLAPPSPAPGQAGGSRSGSATPERIRFKAFPYSGVNDYMMYCEAEYLSVGGG